ncbi:MAG TPA: triple tyrosine motif-containing protein, partial [Desulfuromonadaceae bacterium]|nr:triple tyrosine motif-containing protein [Desulfuromonadaceae bacterium]
GSAACVVADPAGGIWIGTRTAALYHLRDGTFSHYARIDGLVSRIVHSLLVSSNGDVWVGGTTPDSLQRLRNGRFDNFRLPENSGYVRTLAQSTDGRIWAGTVRAGLLSVDPSASNSPCAQTAVTNSIRNLIASGNSLWIGCAGDGLKRYKDGWVSTLTSRDGLADDYLSEIIADGNGWLWFGSDHGIFKVREQELNAAMDGTNRTVQSVRYGRNQGLPALQASHDDSPNTWRTATGKLLMAMSSGLAVADPERLRDNPGPPLVLINKVLVDDAVVAAYGGVLPAVAKLNLQRPGTALSLPPGAHRVELNFTALNFTAPENVVFQYRFAGFDDHWLETAANQRTVVYPRLEAGEYQFSVRAKNGDGTWSRQDATLPIFVAPFIWQTWWFRMMMLFILLGAVITVVRYLSFRRLRRKLQSLEQQAALNRERSRIARDIHDDLGASMTRATWLLDRLRQSGARPESADASLAQLSSTIQQVNASLDEIVWAVNPRNDRFPLLVDFIGEYAAEFLQAAGVKCRIDSPEDLPEEMLTPEQRHNLFLAVKEALNNIARHAGATEVWLRFRIFGDVVEVAVEDNGHGIGTAAGRSGADGLRNMDQRMKMVGGQCRAENIPAGGTRIVFAFPVPRTG